MQCSEVQYRHVLSQFQLILQFCSLILLREKPQTNRSLNTYYLVLNKSLLRYKYKIPCKLLNFKNQHRQILADIHNITVKLSQPLSQINHYRQYILVLLEQTILLISFSKYKHLNIKVASNPNKPSLRILIQPIKTNLVVRGLVFFINLIEAIEIIFIMILYNFQDQQIVKLYFKFIQNKNLSPLVHLYYSMKLYCLLELQLVSQNLLCSIMWYKKSLLFLEMKIFYLIQLAQLQFVHIPPLLKFCIIPCQYQELILQMIRSYPFLIQISSQNSYTTLILSQLNKRKQIIQINKI
ncbi:transmembrane protein, putative (macronuclear) [Tetrahymena thermophila SB210]|uniref:Transmembrane protein, putative n=1 Tax=Tetrahymena thermophila (strain SB210) TaxID=312017 RepID=W7XCF6_TETTS|nr:transmembrane protein, putative [Tetrahymena thermophila SB210]EWS75132.1 transmembrane protein, putative [Tetrahymena thermophila SB210]|eukprot:XP_012652370.1 transmembrane protein, putative [Tetrahymena thermophila SB210]